MNTKNLPKEVREKIAHALGMIGDEISISALIATMKQDSSPYVRAAAALALSWREGVRDVLITALGDESSAVRAAAAIALSCKYYETNGAEFTIVVSALAGALLNEKSITVRKLIVDALGRQGGAIAANAAMRALAHDRSAIVREAAATTLGHIGDVYKNITVEALIKAMSHDSSPRVRAAAALALSHFSNEKVFDTRAIVEALTDALHDSSISVQKAAVTSLKLLRASGVLANALASTYKEVKNE